MIGIKPLERRNIEWFGIAPTRTGARTGVGATIYCCRNRHLRQPNSTTYQTVCIAAEADGIPADRRLQRGCSWRRSLLLQPFDEQVQRAGHYILERDTRPD